MRTNTRNNGGLRALCTLPLFLAAWLLLPQSAHSSYNPGTGRWLSRDPINEPRLKALTHKRGGFNRDEEKNLYGFVRNGAVSFVDRLGQDVWVIRSPVWPGHEWVVGDNADGTYWEAAFWPNTPSGYGINCCGIIKFLSRSGFDPKKLTDGIMMKAHVKTSPAVDAKVKAEAERRSKEKKQPRFDAWGNNCRDFARGMAWFARGAQMRENHEREHENEHGED